MFKTKKTKIKEYLDSLSERTPFDELLGDWIDEKLKSSLSQLGIKRTEIHIDWIDGIRCIGIQGVYECYYLDIQIDPDEYYFAAGLDETEDGVSTRLTSAKAFYDDVGAKIAKLS